MQTAARELFTELERSAAPVLPLRFLTQLRASFPQFAEMSTAGLYKQQDAEECWTQLLYTLRERLQVTPKQIDYIANAAVTQSIELVLGAYPLFDREIALLHCDAGPMVA